MNLRLAFAAIFGFALGVLLTIWGYDSRDAEQAKQVAEQVRKCKGYLVVTSDGKTTECRNLMLRFDYWWPCPKVEPRKTVTTQVRNK